MDCHYDIAIEDDSVDPSFEGHQLDQASILKFDSVSLHPIIFTSFFPKESIHYVQSQHFVPGIHQAAPSFVDQIYSNYQKAML